ncbi:MAG: hypothetical protein ACREDR_36740, partial [Blastocatellia bacterium]
GIFMSARLPFTGRAFSIARFGLGRHWNPGLQICLGLGAEPVEINRVGLNQDGDGLRLLVLGCIRGVSPKRQSGETYLIQMKGCLQ